jgi:hypothetical protein
LQALFDNEEEMRGRGGALFLLVLLLLALVMAWFIPDRMGG